MGGIDMGAGVGGVSACDVLSEGEERLTTLRLLLFPDCERDCKGCCNKDWDLDGLPEVWSFEGYEMILLTGGEPMLRPLLAHAALDDIKDDNPDAKIIMYTADVRDRMRALELLDRLDGMTVTLHDQEDVRHFLHFNVELWFLAMKDKSMRLNVFKGVELPSGWTLHPCWQVKEGVEWQENCPLPEGEEFKRWLLRL